MKRISLVVLLLEMASLAFVSLAAAESLPKTKSSWLTPYPGANVEAASATETSFVSPAKPEELIGHYRKLLTAAGLPFIPNFDGVGTSIRAAAPECDLLIRIRESDLGSSAKVNCQARTAGAITSLYGTDVGIVNPEPPPAPAPEKPAAAPEKPAAGSPDEHEQKTPPAAESKKIELRN